MGGDDVSADHIIAELIDMGFEFCIAVEAIKSVGPCLQDAIEFILGSAEKKNTTQDRKCDRSLSSYCLTSKASSSGKRFISPRSVDPMKQPRIKDHLPSLGSTKKRKASGVSDTQSSGYRCIDSGDAPLCSSHKIESKPESSEHQQAPHSLPPLSTSQEMDSDWEQRVNIILHKHFGFSSLKGFQKEAIGAWLDNRDCLVLAATGSGKSLCFQIPALLTGKVVVVISPLISLMHDQCLKLVKHGVSACFLGSGQSDGSIEDKAMRGMYGIIYVCPETVLRLIGQLERLAETRGIALFAIDEVHCVSKWGHDFRPDYRKLFVLRESFKACKLKSLEYDIPLMALTATATNHVRDDILKSLHMSKETKIVLTSFFRPNLRFSVKHSRTSCISSYDKDFRELIEFYRTKRGTSTKESDTHLYNIDDEFDGSCKSECGSPSDSDERSLREFGSIIDNYSDENNSGINLTDENAEDPLEANQLSVEFLEDEVDGFEAGDDLDVACGEFLEHSPSENWDDVPHKLIDPTVLSEERLKLLQGYLEHGPTIIYMPTRKETLRVAKYLCSFGVRAAAYHAKLPKTHLRRVHEEFHQNGLQVVVATIAFGMGIDKSNVRRIIHYGWPQSLEAYYQEAGRAGRDGKLADCTLYADLSRIPTLLPSQRSEEQTRSAYKMLSDLFRYAMDTRCCRAKTLVKYFGEEFCDDKCLLCDICVGGPPKLQNLKVEADAFMRVVAAYYGHAGYDQFQDRSEDCKEVRMGRHMEKLDTKMVISRIREQFHDFAATDRLWWQGLARILEEKRFIKEEDYMNRVCIKYPVPTELGLRFLSETEESFYAYPEADMLLSLQNPRPNSSFSEWGRGWADPEIRRQRLQGKKGKRQKTWKKKNRSKHRPDIRTARGRITAKLAK